MDLMFKGTWQRKPPGFVWYHMKAGNIFAVRFDSICVKMQHVLWPDIDIYIIVSLLINN
jgi:hypothetical protein